MTTVRIPDRTLTTALRDRSPFRRAQAVASPATPSLQVVILAAGMGTRLGRDAPKPLTPLLDGRTILQRYRSPPSWASGASRSWRPPPT
jgi:hypothetical protein